MNLVVIGGFRNRSRVAYSLSKYTSCKWGEGEGGGYMSGGPNKASRVINNTVGGGGGG